MWFFLDLLVIAIIAFYIFISAKHGFVRTFIEFIGFGLSIYLAFVIGGAVAEPIYESSVKSVIIDSVTESIEKSTESNIEASVETAWKSLPGYVVTVAEGMDITAESISEAVAKEANGTNIAEVLAEKTELEIARPIVIPLIKTAIAIPLIFILMLVVKLVARILGRMFNFSVVGKVNRILGGILGFGKGVIIAGVIAIIITTIVSLTDKGFLFFTMENIENSFIFGLLADFSPIL